LPNQPAHPEALVGVVFYAQSAHIASPLVSAKTHFHQLRQAIDSGGFARAPTLAQA